MATRSCLQFANWSFLKYVASRKIHWERSYKIEQGKIEFKSHLKVKRSRRCFGLAWSTLGVWNNWEESAAFIYFCDNYFQYNQRSFILQFCPQIRCNFFFIFLFPFLNLPINYRIPIVFYLVSWSHNMYCISIKIDDGDVFSDKDCKPRARLNHCALTLWDVKGPTHWLCRVGHPLRRWRGSP